MDWINVKTTLPPTEEQVLVATERGRIAIGVYASDLRKWYDYEAQQRNEYIASFSGRNDAVTHWTPLPALPGA